jgi:hypothetical protein
MVKSLKELDQYPWSGHGVLMGKVRNNWQERDCVLRQFSEIEVKAVAGYRKFMEEGKDQGRRPELVGGGLIRSLGDWSRVQSLVSNPSTERHDARILGGDDFVTNILKEADKNLRRQFHPQERKKVIEQLIRKVCRTIKGTYNKGDGSIYFLLLILIN